MLAGGATESREVPLFRYAAIGKWGVGRGGGWFANERFSLNLAFSRWEKG